MLTLHSILEPKSDAIDNIGMDEGMKVVMRFNEAWWESATGGPVSCMITEGPAAWCWPLTYKKYYDSSGEQDHILVCFSMGQNAIDLKSNAKNDKNIIEAVLDDLDAMFPNTPATDSYSGDGYVQDWGAHEYTRGVYSFPTVDTIDDDGNAFKGNARKTLQQPVGRILFAGEATHLTASASVPGAGESKTE